MDTLPTGLEDKAQGPGWVFLAIIYSWFTCFGTWPLLFPRELARVRLMQPRLLPEHMEHRGTRMFYRTFAFIYYFAGTHTVFLFAVDLTRRNKWDTLLCRDFHVLPYVASAILYLASTKILFSAWLAVEGDMTQRETWTWPIVRRVIAKGEYTLGWRTFFTLLSLGGMAGMVRATIGPC